MIKKYDIIIEEYPTTEFGDYIQLIGVRDFEVKTLIDMVFRNDKYAMTIINCYTDEE